jgi:hypothetical protein
MCVVALVCLLLVSGALTVIVHSTSSHLPTGWTVHSHNGKTYYYNAETRVSSWTPPEVPDKSYSVAESSLHSIGEEKTAASMAESNYTSLIEKARAENRELVDRLTAALLESNSTIDR